MVLRTDFFFLNKYPNACMADLSQLLRPAKSIVNLCFFFLQGAVKFSNPLQEF